MITYNDAEKLFEGKTYEATPTAQERVLIPVRGFVGAKEEEFTSWDGSKQKVKGFKFLNETDSSEQVAAVDGGVIMFYEGNLPNGQKRSEATAEYLKKHPLATKTINGVKELVDFLKTITVSEKGKYDLYTTDENFLANKIVGAPTKENIAAGQVIVGQKKGEIIQAVKVGKGVEFEGAAGTASTQKAGDDGAYLIKDSAGIRLIQSAEFQKAYKVTKVPTLEKSNSAER